MPNPRSPPTLSRSSKRSKYTKAAAAARRRTPSYRYSIIPNPVDFGNLSFPHRIKNKMRYSTTTTLTILTNGDAYVAFRANGLYDPEVAIGGHQPLYYDQLNTLYNHWHVVASKCTMRVLPATGIGGACTATMLQDDDTNLTATLPIARERPGAINWLVTTAETDKGRTQYWNAQNTFGGNIIDNSDLAGTINLDPVEQTMFWLVLSDGTTGNTFKIVTDIEYTVVWSELKSMDIS